MVIKNKEIHPLFEMATEQKAHADSNAILSLISESKRFNALKTELLGLMDDIIEFYKNALNLGNLFRIIDRIKKKDYFNEFDSIVLSNIKYEIVHNFNQFLCLEKPVRHMVKYRMFSYFKVVRWILENSNDLSDIKAYCGSLNDRIKKIPVNCDNCGLKPVCPKANNEKCGNDDSNLEFHTKVEPTNDQDIDNLFI